MDDMVPEFSKDAISEQMAAAAAEIDAEMAEQTAQIDDGIEVHGGRKYMRLATGNLQLVDNIRPQSLLQDQLVRKLIAEAVTAAGAVQVFRNHALDEVEAFSGLLAEKYGVKRGGDKGNIALTTVDGSMKVERSIGEFIDFGPELESARALVEECLLDWSDGARPELVSIVQRAFQSKKGKVNRVALLELLRLDIDDPRWKRAMQAINDAIIVVATKAYPRFYKKDARGKWEAINIDVASAPVQAVAS